jgi:hypothetical protein
VILLPYEGTVKDSGSQSLAREWGAARDWNTVEQVEEGVKEALEKMIELFNVTVQLKSRVQVKERGGDNVGGTFKARDVWYQQSS